jgi:hypothetical protein
MSNRYLLLTAKLSALVAPLLLAMPAASAQNYQPERSVRVTTGSVQVSGWEQGIVQSNPNLSHFTWMPMSSNLQGIRKIPAGSGPTGQAPLPPKQTGPAYNHIPTPTAPRELGTGYNHVPTSVSNGSHYLKPIHVQTEIAGQMHYTKPIHTSEAADERSYLSGQLRPPQGTEAQSFGKLGSRPQADEQLSGQLRTPPRVAVYGQSAGASNQSTRTGTAGMLESREVYGKITGR